MDILAGAFGGNVSVWQTVVSGDGVSDVSGALEAAMNAYQDELGENADEPSGASVYRSGDAYAVVLMFGTLPNG